MNSLPDSTAMVEHHGAQRGMTRIRKVILYRLKEGYPVEAIHDLYPWVHIQVLEGALDEAIQLVNTTIHAATTRTEPRTTRPGEACFRPVARRS